MLVQYHHTNTIHTLESDIILCTLSYKCINIVVVNGLLSNNFEYKMLVIVSESCRINVDIFTSKSC